MQYLMGIDIGTSSLRSTIVDEQGNIKAVAAQEYTFDSPKLGFAEQDPEVWWNALTITVKKTLDESQIPAREIKGIGLSGQMHGMIPVDKDNRVLHKAILHCDVRSGEQANNVNQNFNTEEIHRTLYNPIFPGMQLVSLLWFRDTFPEEFAKVKSVLCPKDYIRYKLTGEIATERTDAAGTVAYDVKNQRWASDFLQKLDLDLSIFPDEEHTPFEIAGTITKQAHEETGLEIGTPVAYGGGDQAMQSVGNGLYQSGDAMSTIGTSGQIMFITDSPVFNPRLNSQTFTHVQKDVWFGMAAMLSAGVTLNWFRKTFMSDYSYAQLSEMTRGIKPGSNGLLFFAPMMGERTPYLDSNTRGVFHGFSFLHKREHFVRAVMEGVCYEMKMGLDILHSLYGIPKKMIVAGGVTNSPEWMQILANVYNLPVTVRSKSEQACVGAAIMAGVGSKVFSSIEEGCNSLLSKEKEMTIEPIQEEAKIYQEIYENVFRQFYEQNKELFYQQKLLEKYY